MSATGQMIDKLDSEAARFKKDLQSLAQKLEIALEALEKIADAEPKKYGQTVSMRVIAQTALQQIENL